MSSFVVTGNRELHILALFKDNGVVSVMMVTMTMIMVNLTEIYILTQSYVHTKDESFCEYGSRIRIQVSSSNLELECRIVH